MTFGGYLKIFRRRWIVIVLSTLAAAVAMWTVTPAQAVTEERPVDYTATATILVAPYPVPTATDGSTAAPDPRAAMTLDRIALYITTGTIPERAAKALDFSEDPALLAAQIVVVTDPGAQAITISATMADGERAAEVVNRFAAEAVRFFERDRTVRRQVVLTILQEGTPLPNWPEAGFVIPADRPTRTAIAAGLGLLLGLALALILEQIFARLRSRDEVVKTMRIPVLAEVPKLGKRARGKSPIMVAADPLSPYADAYRGVRAALLHSPLRRSEAGVLAGRVDAGGGGGSRVILVTSAHAGEGKTTSVANLAASFAETGLSVLVLDADLRSPDAHLLLDVPEGAGISDYLANPTTTSLERLARPTTVPGVKIVTAGTSLDRPETLTSRLGGVVAEAKRLADVVLIDTAPVLEASDTFDVLPLVDSLVLVVRSGRLTEVDGTRTTELLRRFQVTVAGVILVAVSKTSAGKYGYGYGADKGGRRAEAPTRRARGAAPVESAPAGSEEMPATEPEQLPAIGERPQLASVADEARDD